MAAITSANNAATKADIKKNKNWLSKYYWAPIVPPNRIYWLEMVGTEIQ